MQKTTSGSPRSGILKIIVFFLGVLTYIKAIQLVTVEESVSQCLHQRRQAHFYGIIFQGHKVIPVELFQTV
jgi:hypothetical protein